MSVWSEILAAVATRVTGLSGLPATPKTREIPRLIEGVDTLPVLLVCPAGSERVTGHAFTAINFEEYPVLIAWVKANDQSWTLTASEQTARQLINDTLDQRPPLASVTAATVVDVDLQMLDLYDVVENSTVVKAFGVLATYSTYRTRTSP